MNRIRGTGLIGGKTYALNDIPIIKDSPDFARPINDQKMDGI
jgi:hypothetical protein